jgi:hypothetical protein
MDPFSRIALGAGGDKAILFGAHCGAFGCICGAVAVIDWRASSLAVSEHFDMGSRFANLDPSATLLG